MGIADWLFRPSVESVCRTIGAQIVASAFEHVATLRANAMPEALGSNDESGSRARALATEFVLFDLHIAMLTASHFHPGKAELNRITEALLRNTVPRLRDRLGGQPDLEVLLGRCRERLHSYAPLSVEVDDSEGSLQQSIYWHAGMLCAREYFGDDELFAQACLPPAFVSRTKLAAGWGEQFERLRA